MSEFGSLKNADVDATFRALAEEHAAERELQDRARAWRLVERRLQQENPHEPPREELGPARTPLWRNWSWRIALPALAALATTGMVARSWLTSNTPEATLAALPNGPIRTQAVSKSVDFSDGSRLMVAPHTSVSVEVLDARASRTRLEHGSLEVSLRANPGMDYRFSAGPYEVSMSATRFSLSWDPVKEAFTAVSREGNLRVHAPDGSEKVVAAGQRLELGPPQSAVAASAVELQAPIVSVEGTVSGEKPFAGDRSPRKPADAPSTEPSDFASLVAKGRFAEVVSAAESQGLEQVLREKGAQELSALGHAANYTGRSPLAVQAWSTLRKRFGAHRSARQAAFFLGRIHEQQGRLHEALGWLDTYLTEARKDTYVPEAAGRRLLLIQKLEGPLVAQKAAREYLERFPNGAYASNARALLTRP